MNPGSLKVSWPLNLGYKCIPIWSEIHIMMRWPIIESIDWMRLALVDLLRIRNHSFMEFPSIIAFESQYRYWVVYDRPNYFGLGPIPIPKPKLANTFGRYCNRYRKQYYRITFEKENLVMIVRGIFSNAYTRISTTIFYLIWILRFFGIFLLVM